MRRSAILFILLTSLAVPVGAEEQPFFERGVLASHDDGAKKCYPCIATLSDGRMLAVWCNWPSEGCHIVGAFSEDSGKTWGEPSVLIQTPTGRDYDPSILVSGKKIFVTSTTLPPNTAIRTSTTWCTRSDDNGKTWSELYEIPMNHRYTCGKAHRGIRLKSGTLLMGYSWDVVCEKGEELTSEGDMVLRAGVMRSVDDGKTWQNGGDTFAEYEKVHEGAVRGTDEPGLAELPDGSVFMLMRTGGRNPWEARSDDEGRTWKDIKPSPLTGCNAPAALCDFTSEQGKGVLCVWDNGIARYPLCATVSFDGARTWSRPKDVAGPTEGRQASYPNCVQAPDGTLVAVWQQDTATSRDIRFARFNIAWVLDDPVVKMQQGLEQITLPSCDGDPVGYGQGDPTAASPEWRKHAGGGEVTAEGTLRLDPVGGYHIDATPDAFDGNASLLVECRAKVESIGSKANAAAELWVGGSNLKSGCRLLFRPDAVAFNQEFSPRFPVDASEWHEYRVLTDQRSKRAYLFVDDGKHPVLAAPLESVEGLDVNRILFGDSGSSEYDVHGSSEWDWVHWRGMP